MSDAYYYGVDIRLVRHSADVQDRLGVECWCLERRGPHQFDHMQAYSMPLEDAKKAALMSLKLKGEA